MATPIRIKRSAVAGKRPQVTDLQVGELALNTYDAELVTLRDRFSQTGIATEVVRLGAGATVTNVIYVTKDGNDNNTGLKLGDAKATIKSAVGIAATGDVIRVSAGSYVENNPIDIPPQVSIVGDSLREVSVTPQNASSDLFYVAPGNYLSELSFTGSMNSGKAIVSFNPNKRRYSAQSPYISNCTNFIQNSIGMKIDGDHVIGPFKSMVTDSYTQYNSNGIGVSITNNGYAQLVSIFTINPDVSIFTGSGGQCDLTNSNSSFGNFGLVSNGVGDLNFTGIVTSSKIENSSEFEINLSTPVLSVKSALYDSVSGLLTTTTYTPHGLTQGIGVTLQNYGFTCPTSSHTYQWASSELNSVTANTGAEFTPTDGTYNSDTGYMTLTMNGHGLTGSTSHTISTATYNPSSGITTITINSHGFNTGDYVKVLAHSLRFTCAKDNHATNHDYPRISDPIYNKWIPISNVSTNTFDIDVGVSRDTSAHTFISATSNGLVKANNTVGISTGGLKFSCSADGYSTNKPYPRITDPAHNAILGLEIVTTNTIQVNVGVATQDTFPTGMNGYNFTVNSIVGLNTFTTYVGANRYIHNFVSGGNVSIDVVRPFDGQVVYFDELYKVVDKIKVTNGGSGYTIPPTVTIGSPSESWGIPATAIAELTAGQVSSVTIVTSGRGYTSTPSISISGGDGSAAAVSLTMKPQYFNVSQATPISSGISTVTFTENIPFAVGVGTTVPFFKQSRILASSHSFEYIGSGTDLIDSLPSRGGVAIQDNEVDDRDGGLTIFTSTDQAGNFRIGDGVIINQQSGTITGTFYSKSLFSQMTPFILALGGD
tara:strand:- start:17890 stop:20364 length:2475 start_codon:yes stop_codon:yes gene_type:complete